MSVVTSFYTHPVEEMVQSGFYPAEVTAVHKRRAFQTGAKRVKLLNANKIAVSDIKNGIVNDEAISSLTPAQASKFLRVAVVETSPDVVRTLVKLFEFRPQDIVGAIDGLMQEMAYENTPFLKPNAEVLMSESGYVGVETTPAYWLNKVLRDHELLHVATVKWLLSIGGAENPDLIQIPRFDGRDENIKAVLRKYGRQHNIDKFFKL